MAHPAHKNSYLLLKHVGTNITDYGQRGISPSVTLPFRTPKLLAKHSGAGLNVFCKKGTEPAHNADGMTDERASLTTQLRRLR
jgi:hypothetical protein